ncbi:MULTISPECIES: hypothetical protein [Xanthomonas]|uniref:Phage protein n=2 Tax=Xanthomonas citri TaxID=346 RepID=A0AB33CCP2_XANCI|nr:hypothetical protein [Xanthomonas citri]ASK91872.1 hypothetical protein XcvCFBP7111P_10450 [Xanthomonas citri pv. vignicola]MBV6780956.1 hypothetical protein [Xanthomonas campestris pv. trichodesmae]MBV6788480.1 hypothetical protein [Xanthomonas campestris pv. clerodendri]MBZ3922914.1 hypothetical protein [Xanthomonas citri pv. sesbaniae]
MSQIKIEVDADNLLGRQFTELERQQLPYAVVQAVNATAFEIRQVWQRTAARVFDRPVALTRNAVLYRRAGSTGGRGGFGTTNRPYAEIWIRDDAFKGNPPSKYLRAQVDGGERRKKGFEVLLQQKGVLPAGMFAVAGRGAKLDAFGNVPAGTVTRLLSQLGAARDAYQNETPTSRKRRTSESSRAEYLGRGRKGNMAVVSRTVRRGGRYFALQRQRGKLPPGIYERIGTGFGSAVRSVFVFTRRAQYTPRYDIYGLAQRSWDKLMPFHFNRELDKAMQTAFARGGR